MDYFGIPKGNNIKIQKFIFGSYLPVLKNIGALWIDEIWNFIQFDGISVIIWRKLRQFVQNVILTVSLTKIPSICRYLREDVILTEFFYINFDDVMVFIHFLCMYSVWHLVLQILREIFRSTFIWNYWVDLNKTNFYWKLKMSSTLFKVFKFLSSNQAE